MLDNNDLAAAGVAILLTTCRISTESHHGNTNPISEKIHAIFANVFGCLGTRHRNGEHK